MEHFVSGRGAWRVGARAFWTRYRGLTVEVLLVIVFAGTPWWWPGKHFLIGPEVQVKYVFIAVVVACGALLIVSLVQLRHRSVRSLEAAHHLHELAHFIRDKSAECVRLGRAQSGYDSGRELESYGEALCERIKDYFSCLTGDITIEAAIRLATEPQDIVEYATIGRSSGLSRARKVTTEPLPANVGIARFLSEEHGSRGVLLYRDLQKAADKGTYRLTHNDKEYRGEIVTMMAAPMNAWSDAGKSMIGILYVTSRLDNTFATKHVDSVRFAADTTASCMAHAVECLRSPALPA